MPEAKHLHHVWFRSHAVVEVVMNAGEMNAADLSEPNVTRSCADGRLC